MAKAPKTMTPAEKKLAQANLKAAMKLQSEAVKAVAAGQKEADKALAELTNHFLLKTLGSVQPHNFRDRWQNILGELVGFV